MLKSFNRLPGLIDLIVRRIKLARGLGVGVLTIVESHQSLRRRPDDSGQRIIKEGEGPAQIYFKVALLNILQDRPISFLAFTERVFPSITLGYVECSRQHSRFAMKLNQTCG